MKSAKAEGLTLRAAIYARKSQDDSEKNPEEKSVTRQIDHARDYAKTKGWTVDEDAIFVDDGISGAEYVNRPALARLMTSLKHFDVLVMSESSRLGRDMTRNAAFVVNIIESGIKIFYYLTNEEERADTPEQKIMLTLRSYASEVERLKAGQRSRDALERKAKAGYNAGGLVYGYDNVPVYADDGETKSHTSYRINEAQAKVVRAIYRMYADGYGAKLIAYSLNGNPPHRPLLKQYFGGNRPTAPRPTRAATWSSNTIHDLLRNPRYLGFIPYGATRKKYIQGTKRRVRAEEQLFPAPALRIVPESLAASVKQRAELMAKIYLRFTKGQLGGRPEAGRASRYLLSGLVRCAECEASMIVSSGAIGSGRTRRRVKQYMCSGRSNRGPSTCSNGVHPRLEALDREVLNALGHHISPAAVRAAARRAVEIIQAQNAAAPNKSEELRKELALAEAKAARYVAAIGVGGELESLVKKLAAVEARCGALRRELAEMESPPLLDELSDARLDRRLAERAAHWREVLAGDSTLARQALRALLAGPITFTPEHGGYRLRGATKIGALWEPERGAGVTRVKMASPKGRALNAPQGELPWEWRVAA